MSDAGRADEAVDDPHAQAKIENESGDLCLGAQRHDLARQPVGARREKAKRPVVEAVVTRQAEGDRRYSLASVSTPRSTIPIFAIKSFADGCDVS